MSPDARTRRAGGERQPSAFKEQDSNTTTPSPRQSIAIAPVSFSDRTCIEVTGQRWRTLRPWLIERGVPIVRIGRRSVVATDAFLRALTTDNPTARPWDPATVLAAAARRAR
jgi:hypothetical protein